MNVKAIIIAATVFISIHLVLFQPVFAEPSIQINTSAINSDGSFLSETVVEFIITNPQGQRLGYDPRSKTEYAEFKGGYGATGIGDISGAEAFIRPTNGNYILEIIGSDLMMFTAEMTIYREIHSEGLSTIEVSGIIDKGLTSKFQFTYNSDPSKPAGTATKVVTASSLKQDITLSGKIGWIDNDGIMNSLLKKVEAVEAAIAKGNKETAKNELNAFINEVNAQKSKHISDKAAKILLKDAQYMMESL